MRKYENVIRTFIYAPIEYRKKRVMDIYGDTAEEAKNNIICSDSARASYYKQISEQNWGAYRNYDLLIDSSIGVEETAQLIYEYIEHKK